MRRIDDRGLVIDIPRQVGEDLPLQTGQRIKMFVQIHSRMYEFDSRVRQIEFQLLLDEPGEAKHTERRAFFRLLVTIPGRVWVITDDLEDEPELEDVAVIDLSGGGARIRSEGAFPVGAELELQLSIDGSPLWLRASVIRSSENEHARGAARHEAHCMFTEIRPAEQERIVKFVFQKQREFSQRGVA